MSDSPSPSAYIYYIWFVFTSIHEHLHCFFCRVMVSNAVRNIGMQTFESLVLIPSGKYSELWQGSAVLIARACILSALFLLPNLLEMPQFLCLSSFVSHFLSLHLFYVTCLSFPPGSLFHDHKQWSTWTGKNKQCEGCLQREADPKRIGEGL